MNQNNTGYIYGQQSGKGFYSTSNKYEQMGPIVQGGSSSSSSSSNRKNRYDKYGGQGGPGPYTYGTPEHDHGCLKKCCLACGALACCCCVADCLT